jgi:hypothetical protein
MWSSAHELASAAVDLSLAAEKRPQASNLAKTTTPLTAWPTRLRPKAPPFTEVTWSMILVTEVTWSIILGRSHHIDSIR